MRDFSTKSDANTQEKISTIRIMLIDDEQLIIEGVKALIQQKPNLEVCATANNLQDAMDAIAKETPDLVLLDWQFKHSETNGFDMAMQFLKQNSDLKIIMVTSYGDTTLVKECLNNGVKGYLLKSFGFDELLDAIYEVYKGGQYIDPQIRQELVQIGLGKSTTSDKGNLKNNKNPLTPREYEIALLLADAKTTKDIASLLCRSENTINSHKKNMFSKLNINSAVELVNWLNKKNLMRGRD